MVRGISDLLGDKTNEADKRRQPNAARNAAAFALAFIGRSEPKRARPLMSGKSNAYIGAIGNGANANIAAMGDGTRGHVVFERSGGSGFQPTNPIEGDAPDVDDDLRSS